jgi:protein tyrosine/serine phosphatase
MCCSETETYQTYQSWLKRNSGRMTNLKKPLPSPPFVEVEGLYNLRDLGGWPSTLTAEGTDRPLSVKRNLVFRSAEPSRITEAGAAVLTKTLGVTTIYDLRSTEESTGDTIPGTTRVLAPVFDDDVKNPVGVAGLALRVQDYMVEGTAGYVDAYAKILDDGVRSFRTILEHIRDEPKKGNLIHCAVGKDRTGVICALILRLAGVSDENIALDYNLTERGLAHLHKAMMEKIKTHELFISNSREEQERLLCAKEENMRAVLRVLDERYGGADGYLRDTLGFEPAEVKRIKENLVVDEPAFVFGEKLR